MKGPYVHLNFDVIQNETEKALCIRFFGTLQATWIPKSQIEDAGENYEAGDRNGSMCISEWVAKEKGLI